MKKLLVLLLIIVLVLAALLGVDYLNVKNKE